MSFVYIFKTKDDKNGDVMSTPIEAVAAEDIKLDDSDIITALDNADEDTFVLAIPYISDKTTVFCARSKTYLTAFRAGMIWVENRHDHWEVAVDSAIDRGLERDK
jgi:hypothetical protein